jgi:hypothetical protein
MLAPFHSHNIDHARVQMLKECVGERPGSKADIVLFAISMFMCINK